MMENTEPVAYKFIGITMSWVLREEYSEQELSRIAAVFPMYAPIEDEV